MLRVTPGGGDVRTIWAAASTAPVWSKGSGPSATPISAKGSSLVVFDRDSSPIFIGEWLHKPDSLREPTLPRGLGYGPAASGRAKLATSTARRLVDGSSATGTGSHYDDQPLREFRDRACEGRPASGIPKPLENADTYTPANSSPGTFLEVFARAQRPRATFAPV